jgi:hypothetical protein
MLPALSTVVRAVSCLGWNTLMGSSKGVASPVLVPNIFLMRGEYVERRLFDVSLLGAVLTVGPRESWEEGSKARSGF